MGIKIHVDLEYGYEEFIWNSPFSTVEEAINYWKSLKKLNDFNKILLYRQRIYYDECEDSTEREQIDSCAVHIHAHEHHDSYLRVNDVFYQHAGYCSDANSEADYDYVFSKS